MAGPVNRATHFSGPIVSENGFTGDLTGDITGDITGDVTGDVTGDLTGFVTGVTEAITATDDGSGTGTISDDTNFAVVDSDSDVNHIVVLPTPTPGRVVWFAGAADGAFELRSSAPATVAINGGTGATAESAIATTDVLVRCFCSSATTWICTAFAADGTESAVDAAA